jgi:serine/threonine protein phosphatase 1
MNSSPPNRIFTIGDIHGCDVALETLLNKIGLGSEDTLIVLGDIVDRGPGTKRCIELLIALKQRCNLIVIQGNHEEMLLKAYDTGEWLEEWLHYGGTQVLDSYDIDDVKEIPEEHIEFLRDTIDFVHANLEPKVELADQSIQWLRWERLTGHEVQLPSGKRIICGHTSIKSGIPAVMDGWVCIDTCCYGGKYLTCLNVKTDELYQARQTGGFRDGLFLKDFE